MRSLIDIFDLSIEELDELIATANDIIEHPAAYAERCRGKKLATLFAFITVFDFFLKIFGKLIE